MKDEDLMVEGLTDVGNYVSWDCDTRYRLRSSISDVYTLRYVILVDVVGKYHVPFTK
jgi:hypothetical protein